MRSTAGSPPEAGADGGRGAAFFDLDKTLMEGSSAVHFGRAAYGAGLISRRQLGHDLVANLRFRLKGSTDESSAALRDRILAALAGTRVIDLARLTPEVLRTLLPRVYPEMLKVAYEHQDAGRPAYVVTAASHEVAEMLAHVLVFDGGIGTRSEVRDGVYTGEPGGPFNYRDGKAETIRSFAVENGIDLATSYAYSDSESDLPMLRAVGHPVAVNPDTELAHIAREEGWQVIRFDKLARRLRIAAVAGGLALVGVGSGYAAGELRERRRGPRLRIGR